MIAALAHQSVAFAGDAAANDGGYSALLKLPGSENIRLPTPEEVAKYPTFMPSIPLEKNAARYYLKAISLRGSGDRNIPGGSGSSAEPFKGDMAAFRSWVDSNRQALAAVGDALEAGPAEYPMLINAKTSEPMVVGAPAELRQLTRTCADAGFLEELKGDPDAAAQRYMNCIRVGAQNRMGVVVNSLASWAICSAGRGPLDALIANAPVSDESLREAITVCSAAESTPEQVLDALRREKECFEASAAATEQASATEDHQVAVEQLQALQRLKDRLARPLPEFLATEEFRAEAKSDRSGYSTWRTQLGRMDFGLRATQVRAAIALYQRKNGKLPETLDALCPGILPEVPLDPFTGKPMRYAKTDEGWKIWGVGEDMKDDGGNPTISQKLGNFVMGPDDVVLSGTQSELERRSRAWQFVPRDGWDKAVAALLARKIPVTNELQDAVRRNLKASVETLLAAGADLNAKDWEGRTPVHLAVIGGYADLADFLATKGSELNPKDNAVGLTPLHYAANLGRQEIVRLLLEKGADANPTGTRGQTPLHLTGTREAVDLLLAKNANVNALDDLGQTPLHWASASGRLAVAEQLIKGGADVTLKDKNGLTPLHLAADSGKVELAKLLLAHGADLNARTNQGLTPLLDADSDHRTKMFEFLLSKGPDPNDELYLAIQAKDIDRVKAALARGAQASGVHAFGFTPLDAAIWHNAGKDIGELLLAKGADINERNKVNARDDFHVLRSTPLTYAIDFGRTDIIPLLLARGAEVNPKDPNDVEIPLNEAAARDDSATVKMLLDKGADVRAKDNLGRTALHCAQTRTVAELLLAKGAELNAVDSSMWTPLHSAADAGRLDVVELLVAKGADVNARARGFVDKAGSTPLQLALKEGHTEVADFLRAHGAKE